MKVAVMILNWNGASWLKKCIPSVIEATEVVDGEVWVVDNDSSDESEQICRAHFPGVRFFNTGANLGVAGYNVAAEASDADLLVFLNNDMVVEKSFLLHLIAPFKEKSDIFAVSACVKTYPPSPESPVEFYPEEPIIERGVVRGREMPVAGCTVTRFATGGAMACQRNLFLSLGGFDPIYFPGYVEDIDLSWRAWKRGWIVLYEPASVVYHAGGGTFGRSERVRTLQLRNDFLFQWININAPSLYVKHWMVLPIRLMVAFLRRDWARLKGFVQAAGLFKGVMESRKRFVPHFILDDYQALNRFKQYLHHMQPVTEKEALLTSPDI